MKNNIITSHIAEDETMININSNPTSSCIVEDETIINISFVNTDKGNEMIVDSGAPKSIVSRNWLKKYIKETITN